MTVCIVDTSILVELLDVPGLASTHAEVVAQFEVRASSSVRQEFLLPLAVLIETGNHVAQARDGSARRGAAERFVEFARSALGGDSPFVPTALPSTTDIAAWLDDFPERAMRGVGLADRSLIALWESQRELQPHRRVYIWSLDQHLLGFDTHSDG